MHLLRDAVHISMSNISTEASSKLMEEHARRRQGYIAAPVFGNPNAAKALLLWAGVAWGGSWIGFS
jgi:3-hydroxyisobutyrate dehydrogenase-like beta-hydroxyacid dehydrogenase